MKQRAKKINSSGKYPSTGGGPKPPSPSPIDEAMLAFLSGKPSLEGVEGGMETSVSLHIGKGNGNCREGRTVNECRAVRTIHFQCLSVLSPTCRDEHTLCKKKKQRHSREIDTIHRDVLVTEKKKLEFEMELMKLKMQKVRSEIELLEMRKNSFQSSSYLSLSHFSEI
ncbi:uncharacterized protein LOC125678268 [Ostrea edulis]|uniref:uncharacterized protein LOC125678268 n=1 Tax=Ostrea edulis TaxID=37623 RepID=UPI0024AF9A9A|nr:uncharacterized protein LOC125678268 [Ostrea edulis]